MTKSYTSSVEDTCVACKKDSHPLYGSKSFFVLSPDKGMELVLDNHLCLNCLNSGHFTKQWSYSRKCRGSHHSSFNKELTTRSSESGQSSQSSEARENSMVVTTHTSQSGHQQQVLLITCQVILVGPDDTSLKARAMLDSASSA